MQIHANCRIRRVYFSDRLYTEEELPTEFKCALCDIPGSASLELPDLDEEGCSIPAASVTFVRAYTWIAFCQ